MRALFFAIFVWTSFARVSNSEPLQIQVTAGNVRDTRPSGDQAGEMKIQVKLTVAGITNDAKGFRVVVAKALDDTGLDLITRQNMAPEFKNIIMIKDFELKLKNPSRKAGSIKELSGNVELFVPKNDPAASVMVNSFPKHMGTPIRSDALKSKGVEIVARTGEQYEALQQKNETERFKTGPGKQPQDVQTVTMRTAGFMKLGPNDIALSIKGASETVVGCEFHDQSDKTIQPSASGAIYHQDKKEFERTLTYRFNARLPETTKLVIFVVTPGALVKVPFALGDITLP
jgi:hypothetical protein